MIFMFNYAAEGQPFAALILAEQTQPLEKAINQGFINQMVYELSAASGGRNRR